MVLFSFAATLLESICQFANTVQILTLRWQWHAFPHGLSEPSPDNKLNRNRFYWLCGIVGFGLSWQVCQSEIRDSSCVQSLQKKLQLVGWWHGGIGANWGSSQWAICFLYLLFFVSFFASFEDDIPLKAFAFHLATPHQQLLFCVLDSSSLSLSLSLLGTIRQTQTLTDSVRNLWHSPSRGKKLQGNQLFLFSFKVCKLSLKGVCVCGRLCIRHELAAEHMLI